MTIAAFIPIANTTEPYKRQGSPSSTTSSQSLSPVFNPTVKMDGHVVIDRSDEDLPPEVFKANGGPGAYLVQHDAPTPFAGLDRFVIEDYTTQRATLQELNARDITVLEGEDPMAVARLVAGITG